MASAASASPSLSLNQSSHFKHQTSLITWLKPPSSSALFRRKILPLSSPVRRLSVPISASSSSSSSTSLSVSEKPTANSVHFHGNLIESFQNQDSFAGSINGTSLIDQLENPVQRNGISGRRRLFMQDL